MIKNSANNICKQYSIVKEAILRNVFLTMALHIECRFNKNSVPDSYFLAFLLTSAGLEYNEEVLSKK